MNSDVKVNENYRIYKNSDVKVNENYRKYKKEIVGNDRKQNNLFIKDCITKWWQ